MKVFHSVPQKQFFAGKLVLELLLNKSNEVRSSIPWVFGQLGSRLRDGRATKGNHAVAERLPP
jgi:hypothetical protein